MKPGDLVGSSPHTRGAHPSAVRRRPYQRIIPAYAGSTLFSLDAIHQTRDHPRIRGEHSIWRRHDVDRLGSSPHTRGARPAGRRRRQGRRIIPAYAGSTRRRGCRRRRRADHPRIRGEHVVPPMESTTYGGSSPHTRGARRHRRPFPRPRRIIPAYAGSTRGMCLTSLLRSGSSPHTRGAPSPIRSSRKWERIIPAYAGSTSTATSRCPNRQDHPRIRGEHAIERLATARPSGSSPHTRGAPRRRLRHRRHSGIIPAYAGSTWSTSSTGPGSADHPRIRGEHPICVISAV